MENNKKFLQNLRVIVTNEQPLQVDDKKIEIRESTNSNAGFGVFALEDIPYNTIFLECFNFNNKDYSKSNNDIGYFINDLAYNNDLVNYETESNVNANINIGYVCRYNNEANLFLGSEPDRLFLRSLKNIKKGDELSKYYGLDYWKSFEFWQNFPDCKFSVTHDHDDLPPKYVLIDTLIKNLYQNVKYFLYGKKMNDKHYYVITNAYFDYMTDDLDEVFEKNNSNVKIINITKTDNSKFSFNEKIYEEFYLESYLKYEYDKKIDTQIKHENEFWKKHSNSKFKETENEEDLPSDYVCVDRLINESIDLYLSSPKSKFLYAKKLNGKFYYLISKKLHNFDEFDKSYFRTSADKRVNQMMHRKIYFDENDCEEVSKSDHSKYYFDEKINGLVRLSYARTCKVDKLIKQQYLKDNFLLKHNIDEDMIYHQYGDIFVENAITNVYLPIENLTHDDDEKCVKYKLYCKKINDEYYYLLSNISYEEYCSNHNYIPEYFEPEFEDLSKSFIDITKPDKTKYDVLEKFPNDMHTEVYRYENYRRKIK